VRPSPTGPLAGGGLVADHNMDMRDLDLEIGLAFDRPLAAEGEVQTGEIPAGRAVRCVRVGPYDRVGSAYEAVTGSRGPGGVPQAAQARTEHAGRRIRRRSPDREGNPRCRALRRYAGLETRC
jgi:hypothetical protein